MLRSKLSILFACGVLLVSVAALTGCGEKDPGPSKETQLESDRLTKIQQSTGGDWNKLTPEDKDYLVNTLAHGNENTAKMLLGPSMPSTPGQPRKPGR